MLQNAGRHTYEVASGASVTQPVDSSILHEIVRIIESRRKVPEKVIVKSKEYVLYCQSERRSAAAAFLLAQRGFKTFVLAGGMWGDARRK